MLIPVRKPFEWISAHRTAEFEYDFESRSSLLFSEETVDGDKLKVSMISVFSETPEVGGLIYIEDGDYQGYHIVRSVSGGAIVTETDASFSGFISGIDVKNITEHVFTIYSGYQIGDLADELPYTLIATFRPEPTVSGTLIFDISGYVTKIFDVINSNDLADYGSSEVAYNTFNQINLLNNGAVFSQHNVMNASIDMYELNRDYVDTGKNLDAGILGNHYLNCDEYYSLQIVGNIVKVTANYNDGENLLITQGIPAAFHSQSAIIPFNNDFNNDFLLNLIG